MKNVNKAIKSLNEKRWLYLMSKEDIHNLLVEVLISHAERQIDDVWHLLNQDLKNNTEIIKCKRCTLHYTNNVIEGDVFDGKPPMQKKLFHVKQIKQINN